MDTDQEPWLGFGAPLEPMLARPTDRFPRDDDGRFAFEPKFDGFRGLLAVNEGRCVVWSRRGTDLTTCFPEIAQAALAQLPAGTVVDGELVVWTERGGRGCLDFSALQRRVVSGTRAAAVAADEPASFMAFDILAVEGRDVRRHGLNQRRALLEDLAAGLRPPLHLTPQTTQSSIALRWLEDYRAAQVGVEGLVIKDLREPYLPGKRRWHKLRIRHTAEAIIGAVAGTLEEPTHLVLGLPRRHGGMLVAGTTTALMRTQADQVKTVLRPVTGAHPWPPELPARRVGSFARDNLRVTLVEPTVVVEIEADTSFEFGRWRHPTRFIRLRPDLSSQDVAVPGH